MDVAQIKPMLEFDVGKNFLEKRGKKMEELLSLWNYLTEISFL